MGQQSGENGRYDCSQQNRLKHPHRQGKHRQLADGNTQDGSIRQPLCIVQRPLGQCLGIANPAAFTFGHGFPNLRPICVVFHLRRRDMGIEQHLAVSSDPGQAAVRYGRKPIGRGQLLQIAASTCFHPIRGQTKFIPQLFLLDVSVIVIQTAHDNHQACQENGNRRQQDRTEDFLCHAFASSR